MIFLTAHSGFFPPLLRILISTISQLMAQFFLDPGIKTSSLTPFVLISTNQKFPLSWYFQTAISFLSLRISMIIHSLFPL
jgi:hypothetical protein